MLKSFHDKDGKSTSVKVETLGTEEEIEKKYGCPDGLEWAKAHVAEFNERERLERKTIKIELSPKARIESGKSSLCSGGDRRRGKSKEHRPNPIVQMGMLMDGYGIPLAVCIFPGNESEQQSMPTKPTP